MHQKISYRHHVFKNIEKSYAQNVMVQYHKESYKDYVHFSVMNFIIIVKMIISNLII